jgi:hypothetical protein
VFVYAEHTRTRRIPPFRQLEPQKNLKPALDGGAANPLPLP